EEGSARSVSRRTCTACVREREPQRGDQIVAAAQSALQPVRLLGKSIGKVAGDFDRLGFRDAVLGNEPRQKGAIDAAGDIMARRNRKKGARVVVEAYGVVEAGRFRCLLTEAHEPFRAV